MKLYEQIVKDLENQEFKGAEIGIHNCSGEWPGVIFKCGEITTCLRCGKEFK